MESILMFQDNETTAMLSSPTTPVWVELFSYVNALFCSNNVAQMLATLYTRNRLLERLRSIGIRIGWNRILMIFARFPSNRWFFKEMVASEEFRGKATSELKQTRQWRRKRGNEIAANQGSKTKPLKVQHISLFGIFFCHCRTINIKSNLI